MMVIGIETATRTGGVAVLSELGVLAEYTSNIEITHSERLMATLDTVVRESRIRLVDVDGFCVSSGPGSFTGLRIGIATVKGLAVATGRPVASVPTLKAIAWRLLPAGVPVCPLLDAKKGQVYAAIYQTVGGTVQELMAAEAVTLSDLLSRTTGPVLFTGEGAALFRKDISARWGDRALFAPLSALAPSASSVAEIGMTLLANGGQVDPGLLTPTYVRRPEAEVAWERRYPSR